MSNDFEKMRAGLNNGTLDLTKVSVAEWMYCSMMAMFADTDSVEINQEIVYQGNYFRMHACIDGVTPSYPMKVVERQV